MKDAEFFDSRISKIEGAGDLGTYVVNIVKEKSLAPTVTNGAEAD
jgi:hypothetical protein